MKQKLSSRRRRTSTKSMRLPGLEHAQVAVLNSLNSTDAKRGYRHAIDGGELGQIQFLLEHVSGQATERYLGRKQRIRSAVNDRIGIEPNP
jgi:hypothetical protein